MPRYAVVVRPEAVDEFLEARHWYESRRDGLGRRFGSAADALVERISWNPFAFPLVYGQTRRGVLTNFPYAIYFRVADDHVAILGIHGRQDPARWQRRK